MGGRESCIEKHFCIINPSKLLQCYESGLEREKPQVFALNYNSLTRLLMHFFVINKIIVVCMQAGLNGFKIARRSFGAGEEMFAICLRDERRKLIMEKICFCCGSL